jgi:hypothetical protein
MGAESPVTPEAQAPEPTSSIPASDEAQEPVQAQPEPTPSVPEDTAPDSALPRPEEE